MKRKTHLILYFILVLCSVGCESALAKTVKHELTSVEECNLPKDAYEATPIRHSVRLIRVKNTNSFEMNLTVAKKTSPLFTTVRVYKLVKNKRVIDHTVTDLSCKNPVMALLWRMLRFKYDRSCRMLPGLTVIDHVNLDDFFHNPRKIATLPAGTRIYDFQLNTKRGVMLCLAWRVEGVDE